MMPKNINVVFRDLAAKMIILDYEVKYTLSDWCNSWRRE